MRAAPSQALTCTLPPTLDRRGSAVQAMGQQLSAGPSVTRTMPPSATRQSSAAAPAPRAMALQAHGLSCQLPPNRPRSGAAQGHLPQGTSMAMPMTVSRADTVPMAPSVAPTPAPQPTRAPLSVEALLPIVKRVARGISGAAGYAYMGEDPEGAGLRFGLLGVRQDTGDLGTVMTIAANRGDIPLTSEVVAELTDQDRATRLQTRLWEPPWKADLMTAAAGPTLMAAQNEFAVEHLLRPAADIILGNPDLASGTALALALDVMAEHGRVAGLALLQTAASGAANPTALKVALITSSPTNRLRLEDLGRDKSLPNWSPTQ